MDAKQSKPPHISFSLGEHEEQQKSMKKMQEFSVDLKSKSEAGFYQVIIVERDGTTKICIEVSTVRGVTASRDGC